MSQGSCTRVSKGCDNCYAVTMTYRPERQAVRSRPVNAIAWGLAHQ